MATYLPVGTLVTKIDDFPMASVSSDDPWDHYLLSPSSGLMQGWCTNDSLLDKASGKWAKHIIGLGGYLLCTKPWYALALVHTPALYPRQMKLYNMN